MWRPARYGAPVATPAAHAGRAGGRCCPDGGDRRTAEAGGARWTALAGWAFGSAGAAFAAWAGPASGDLLRLLLLVIYSPVVLVISGVLMLAPLVVRRARRKLAIPDALVLACLAQLTVVLVASCVLGGSGEIELC